MKRTTYSSLKHMQTAKVGNLYGYQNGGMAGDVFRITGGVMPCIRSTTGGNQQPFILIEHD